LATNDKFVLVVSDLHVGSALALLPEGFQGSNGVTLNLNIGQQYLWQCWKHFVAALPEVVDLLLINGDAVDGLNRKEESRFLCEIDPDFQARAAFQALSPIAERVARAPETGVRNIIMSRGSSYHVGPGGSDGEEMLGLLLQARPGPDGRYTRPWTTMDLFGRAYLDAAHHQSYVIRYRDMPLEREIEFYLSRIARERAVVPKRAVIVRSHVHGSLRVIEEDGVMAISTPCWKLQDNFAALSRYPNRMFSTEIGAVGMWIREGKIDVVPFTYAHPEVPVEVIR